MSVGNVGGFFAANLANASASGIFGANEAKLQLANTVSNYVIANGELTPEQTVAVAQVDKALTLKGEKAKIDLEVGYALEEREIDMFKKHRDLNDRLKRAGAIFF